jgi:hypothetical protein
MKGYGLYASHFSEGGIMLLDQVHLLLILLPRSIVKSNAI